MRIRFWRLQWQGVTAHAFWFAKSVAVIRRAPARFANMRRRFHECEERLGIFFEQLFKIAKFLGHRTRKCSSFLISILYERTTAAQRILWVPCSHEFLWTQLAGINRIWDRFEPTALSVYFLAKCTDNPAWVPINGSEIPSTA
jgi:hypothetical protein